MMCTVAGQIPDRLLSIYLKNEWLNNWKKVNLKPETTDNRGCLTCLTSYFTFGSFSFLLMKHAKYISEV